MTVSGWIIFAIIAAVIMISAMGIADAFDLNIVSGFLVGIILSGIVLGIMLFYYNNTASGKRAFKSQESSFNNGIERSVEVYDATGNLLKTYTGKFDVDYDDNRIIFDDEDNKRHVIYYPTGTVIIDEI